MSYLSMAIAAYKNQILFMVISRIGVDVMDCQRSYFFLPAKSATRIRLLINTLLRHAWNVFSLL